MTRMSPSVERLISNFTRKSFLGLLGVGSTAERLANSENAVPHAGVAELADAMDSKSIGGNPVEVQVLSPVLLRVRKTAMFSGLFSFQAR